MVTAGMLPAPLVVRRPRLHPQEGARRLPAFVAGDVTPQEACLLLYAKTRGMGRAAPTPCSPTGGEVRCCETRATTRTWTRRRWPCASLSHRTPAPPSTAKLVCYPFIFKIASRSSSIVTSKQVTCAERRGQTSKQWTLLLSSNPTMLILPSNATLPLPFPVFLLPPLKMRPPLHP